MTTEIRISQPWFGLVETGDKTVEARIDNPRWKNVEKGDIIKLYHGNKFIPVRITQIYKHKDLGEAWEEHGNKLLPDCESLEEAQTVFSQYYASVNIQHDGIVCFEFETL